MMQVAVILCHRPICVLPPPFGFERCDSLKPNNSSHRERGWRNSHIFMILQWLALRGLFCAVSSCCFHVRELWLPPAVRSLTLRSRIPTAPVRVYGNRWWMILNQRFIVFLSVMKREHNKESSFAKPPIILFSWLWISTHFKLVWCSSLWDPF